MNQVKIKSVLHRVRRRAKRALNDFRQSRPQKPVDAAIAELLAQSRKFTSPDTLLAADHNALRAINDRLLRDNRELEGTNAHLRQEQLHLKLTNDVYLREQEWLMTGGPQRIASIHNPPRFKLAPGMFAQVDTAAIMALAEKVPAGGTIVDIGSLLGMSASLWCNYSEAGRIVCIDPWKYEPWMKSFRDANGPITREAFLARVPDPRIETIQGYSPSCAKGWKDPIDLYWEDGDHNNPACAEGIRFWSQFVKPGGIACGHDYHWLDVKAEAEALAGRWGSTVELFGSVWSVRRPRN